MNKNNTNRAFTIVELLVVIVVIGILAAITTVSYTGIRDRAVTSSIKSQLTINFKTLKMYYIDHGVYPSTLDVNYCPVTPAVDNQYCIKNLSGATLTYAGGDSSFTLTITNNSISYSINSNGDIAKVESGDAVASTSFIRAWGGEGDDDSSNIIRTNDNGYAVAGSTESYSSGGSDIYLSKFNHDGILLWTKTWGGIDYEVPSKLIQSNDGGYVITGNTFGYGSGGQDSFLLKFTSSGEISWNATWGGENSDPSDGLAQTNDGGYLIAGMTGSYGVSKPKSIAYLAKFTSEGILSWSKIWDDGSQINSITQTNDGKIVVVGQTQNDITYESDAFIAKLDSDGSMIWNKTWGDTGFDRGLSVIMTNDNEYAMAGECESYSNGNYDGFLAKFTSDGSLSWSKVWGGAGYDSFYGLVQDSDGFYVAVGDSDSFGVGNYDSILVKFNANGLNLFSKTWGGAGDESAFSIINDDENRYMISGNTRSYGLGESDAFIARYENDGSISNCGSIMCQDIVGAVISSPNVVLKSLPANTIPITALSSNPSSNVSSPLFSSVLIDKNSIDHGETQIP